MDRTDEEKLTRHLESARAGSAASFEVIYVALAPSVASYLRLNGAEDVDDLTNVVFANVHQGLGGFVGDWTGFRSFVFTIAHRRLVDDRRRRGRRPRSDGPVTDQADEGDLEDDALASMGIGSALGLLRELSAEQREVLLLRIVSDLTIDEVARSMGKSPGAVKALQHRALTSLRRALETQQAEQ